MIHDWLIVVKISGFWTKLPKITLLTSSVALLPVPVALLPVSVFW